MARRSARIPTRSWFEGISRMIFVGYARPDGPFVNQLVTALKQHGVETWVDRHSIPGGTHWEAEISKALENYSAVVVVQSPAVGESAHVPSELSLVRDYKRPVIPIVQGTWNHHRRGRLDVRSGRLAVVTELGVVPARPQLVSTLRTVASSAPRRSANGLNVGAEATILPMSSRIQAPRRYRLLLRAIVACATPNWRAASDCVPQRWRVSLRISASIFRSACRRLPSAGISRAAGERTAGEASGVQSA